MNNQLHYKRKIGVIQEMFLSLQSRIKLQLIRSLRETFQPGTWLFDIIRIVKVESNGVFMLIKA